MSETLKDDTHDQEHGPKAPGAPQRAKDFLQQPRIRLGAVAALVLVAAGVAWVVIGKATSSDQTSPPPPTTGPVALSASGLRTLATVVGRPIYWAGPKTGYLYELTKTGAGNVLIRYLPPDVKAGTSKPELTIATYPYPNAFQALKNVAHGRQHTLPGGGLALVDTKSPKSVHIAYPGVNYQVEVYDSSAARSQRVALSGDVGPVH